MLSNINKDITQLIHDLNERDTFNIIKEDNDITKSILKCTNIKWNNHQSLHLKKRVILDSILSRDGKFGIKTFTRQIIYSLICIIEIINSCNKSYYIKESDTSVGNIPIEYAMLCTYAVFSLMKFFLINNSLSSNHIDKMNPFKNFLSFKIKKRCNTEIDRLSYSLNRKDSQDIIRSADCIQGFFLKYIISSNQYSHLGSKDISNKINKLDMNPLRNKALKDIFPKENLRENKKPWSNRDLLNMDDPSIVDDSLNNISFNILTNLVNISNMIHLMRNKHSDAHSYYPKEEHISMKYAILCVNSSFTVTNFLLSHKHEEDDVENYISKLAQEVDDAECMVGPNSDEPPFE